MGIIKYSTIFFGKDKIQITNEYVYLEIPFAEFALFTSAAQLAKSKANMAIGNTIPLLCKLNSNSWRTVNKLFESLVFSNLIYVAQIWGLRYF